MSKELGRRLIKAGVRVGAAMLVVSALYGCERRPVVGGQWNERPIEGTDVSGTIYLSADAYPANPTDAPVERVEFTGYWPGAISPDPNNPDGWPILCTDYTAPYECGVDTETLEGLDSGERLDLSFDVYSSNGKNLAPNGTTFVIKK